MSKTTITQLHSLCAEEIAQFLDPVIRKSEDNGVHRAPEWVDLLLWNVVVAFYVGIASNAAFDGLKRLIARRGHVTRSELDDCSEAISKEILDGSSAVTFEVRQTVARAIQSITRTAPTESQLDSMIKTMRSHLLEADDE